MPLPRQLPHITIPAGSRPRFLTAGASRLLGLCLFIVLVGMIPLRMTPHSARLLLLVGTLVVVGLCVLSYIVARRLFAKLPLINRSQEIADAIFRLVRRVGLPSSAFVSSYAGQESILPFGRYPHAAFTGLAACPRFADFFYYAVSTAFVSPPGDILAASRGVRSATMIEMLAGFALVATYLASLASPPLPDKTSKSASRRAK